MGRPIPGRSVRIIEICEGPIEKWSDELVLPEGEKGEIVVSGEIVTKEYFDLPEATADTKIRDGERIWHRIGDIGYFDEQGSLWYCGRKSHRIETGAGPMFSASCEGVFNQHKHVDRSALVGVGRKGCQEAVMVIEAGADVHCDAARRRAISEELLELGGRCAVTSGIQTVLFHRSFPVDVRHNAKIDRERLAAWAEKQLR